MTACYVWRMRLRAVAILVAAASLALPLVAPAGEREARASVSIAVTWDGLLRASASAAVVTPVDSTAVWENGRIYKYTRVHIDRSVAGDLATGSEALVRTMGGVVGNIGQLVEGEAVLRAGESSLLFLRAGPPGTLEVTARGQGQFPVLAADAHSPARVVRSQAAGALMAPLLVVTSSRANRLAADVLHGRPVDDVAVDVAADWARAHETRP
jgi:hypothetical protein